MSTETTIGISSENIKIGRINPLPLPVEPKRSKKMEIPDQISTVLEKTVAMRDGYMVIDGYMFIPDKRTNKLVPYTIPEKSNEESIIVKDYDSELLSKIQCIYEEKRDALTQEESDALDLAINTESASSLRENRYNKLQDLIHTLLYNATIDKVDGKLVMGEGAAEALAAYKQFVDG